MLLAVRKCPSIRSRNFLNVPVDYYVEVNFDGLTDIVDAIGGVEITSPLTFDFYGPQFIEGETRILNGFEALQFSRMKKTGSGRRPRQTETPTDGYQSHLG